MTYTQTDRSIEREKENSKSFISMTKKGQVPHVTACILSTIICRFSSRFLRSSFCFIVLISALPAPAAAAAAYGTRMHSHAPVFIACKVESPPPLLRLHFLCVVLCCRL